MTVSFPRSVRRCPSVSGLIGQRSHGCPGRPWSFVVIDADGNRIGVRQHVLSATDTAHRCRHRIDTVTCNTTREVLMKKLSAAIAVAMTLATILAPIAMAGGKVFGGKVF